MFEGDFELSGPPAGPLPTRAFMTVRGEQVPLLPMYVGMHEVQEGLEPLHCWSLFVHPAWPEDVELELSGQVGEDGVPVAVPPRLWIDVVPAKSSMALRMELRGDRVVVARYLG